MTKISIYKQSDFKKDGTLKKKAIAEFFREGETLNIPKIADEIKALGYHNFSSSYFFTHIKAESHLSHGEPVKIFQDFRTATGWLITSPQELLTYLA